MKAFFLALSGAALVAVAPAIAQTAQPAPASAHGAQAPKVETRADVQSRIAAHFARFDTNRDGLISREEAQAEPAVRDAWSRLDAKNAGKVSRADFDRYAASQPQSNQFNSGGSTPPATGAPKQ